jgi:3-hydroxyacyl-CoA dehydrogenase
MHTDVSQLKESRPMSSNPPARNIAIVGTGVIGASWAAYYLSRAFNVVATDPGPQAEVNLRKYVDDAWPLLTQVALSSGASRDRLSFSADMNRCKRPERRVIGHPFNPPHVVPLVEVVGGAKTSEATTVGGATGGPGECRSHRLVEGTCGVRHMNVGTK